MLVSSGEYELSSPHVLPLLGGDPKTSPRCVVRGQEMERRPGCVRFSTGKQELFINKLATLLLPPVSNIVNYGLGT